MRNVNSCLAAAVATVLALGGCVGHGRQPEAPAVSLPGAYESAHDTRSAGDVERTDAWWRALGDPALDALVERALADHPDVAVARARIAAARAGQRSAHSGTRPHLDAYAATERVQQSANGLFGAATESGAFPDLYTLHDAGLDASWELDVFGAGRARQRGADARVWEAEADRDAVRLSLAAEVVRTYVRHLVVAQQVAALERSLADAEQYVALIDGRERHGDAGSQEVAEARQELHRLRAELPPAIATRASLRHAMGALLGSGEYVVLPDSAPLLDEAPRLLAAAVEPGAPSDLLRRRPDIRGAEARFQQATAAHQQAVADQYPRFLLLGGVAHEALRTGDLLKAASEAWNIAAHITLPVLDGGRRSAARAESAARLDEATARYRAVVIDALVDVEKSLLVRQATAQTVTEQRRRLAAARARHEIAASRYAAGEIALTELLQSRIACELVRLDEIAARGDALDGVVRLQKSLGGPA